MLRSVIEPKRFDIETNEYLFKKTIGYYNRDYTGYEKPNNPDFLNTLKNTFNRAGLRSLKSARDDVCRIIINDIPNIIKDSSLSDWIITCVPRAKSQNQYSAEQLMFKEAVSIAADQIENVVNGVDYIIRINDTYTTHLDKPTKLGTIRNNLGSKPYQGITKGTCQINTICIKDKNIILIDDIYILRP